MRMANQMDDPEFLKTLKEKLNEGLPYAAARQIALQDKENLLHSPNNTLGL